MARKSNAVLSSDVDTNFNTGGDATAAEFRAQQKDVIDSKAHLDVTDALSTDVAGKANTVHTHVLSDITDAGTAAAADTGTGAGNVPVLDGSGRLPSVDGSQLTNLPGASAASSVNSLTELLALSGVDGQQVTVTGGQTYVYDAASEDGEDGITTFVPTENQTSVEFIGNDTTNVGLSFEDHVRGDRGTSFRANWADSISYNQNDLVRYIGTETIFRRCRVAHTSSSTNDPETGVDRDTFWAHPNDDFSVALIPLDKGYSLPNANIIFGSFYVRNLTDEYSLSDLSLHGHSNLFIQADSPAFQTFENSDIYKNYQILWHKEGRIRDNSAFSAYGGFGNFLQDNAIDGSWSTYGYKYATAPGRWKLVLSDAAPYTPGMIGCIPDDPTIDNYDRLAWLLRAAERDNRKIYLGSRTWYFMGRIDLPNGIVIEGDGIEKSALKVLPETTKSAVFWGDIWHVAHVADPGDYSDNLDLSAVVVVGGGVYRVTCPRNSDQAVIDVGYYFDSTNANYATSADVKTYITTNTLTTVDVAGTTDLGDGVFVEAPGTDKAFEPRMYLGQAEHAISQDGDAKSIFLRGFSIDGNLPNQVGFLENKDYSLFWLGGNGARLSAALRETSNCTGLSVSIEGGRPLQNGIQVYLDNMRIWKTIGSCLSHASQEPTFSGNNVILGDSLSGRVKYGGSGVWYNLTLLGRSRSSVHRCYNERISGYTYKGDTTTNVVWPGNDQQDNITALGVNRLRDPEYPSGPIGTTITGASLDLTGSLFKTGIAVTGSHGTFEGKIFGAEFPILSQNSGTSGKLVNIDIDVTTEDTQTECTTIWACNTLSPYDNANIKIHSLEHHTNDSSATLARHRPFSLPGVAPYGIAAAISLSPNSSALTGDALYENVFDEYKIKSEMQCEQNLGVILTLVSPPADASSWVPMHLSFKDSTFPLLSNKLIGWGGFSAAPPADVSDYPLFIDLDNCGIRLFDPDDTGAAISDQSRRAFVGSESRVDNMLRKFRMRGCYMMNTGGEMIVDPSDSGSRVWDEVNFDHLNRKPNFYSERLEEVSFSATGSELTSNGDGSFYYEVQPGLMWKPKIVSIAALNKITSDNLIPNYYTIHRDASTDSPINPIIRVYFQAQFSASDVVALAINCQVTI